MTAASGSAEAGSGAKKTGSPKSNRFGEKAFYCFRQKSLRIFRNTACGPFVFSNPVHRALRAGSHLRALAQHGPRLASHASEAVRQSRPASLKP